MLAHKSDSVCNGPNQFLPYVFLGCLTLVSPLLAQEERNEWSAALIQKLKDVDSIYLARCTYEVEEKYKSAYDKIWTQPIISNCVLTIDSKTQRKALIKEVTSNPVPDAEVVWGLGVKNRRIGGGFIPVGSPRSVWVDSLGNRTISLQTGFVSRFDNEISGNMVIKTRFVVSPSKQVSKDNPLNLLDLNTATSTQLGHQQWRMLLITGRAYSSFFAKIQACKELPGGLVEISASCSQYKGASWDVVIDPMSSYLVRQARYYQPNEGKPIVKLETEGTITKGSFAMPKKTTWEDHYLGTFSAEYSFKEGRFEFDEATYRRAEDVVRAKEPYVPETLVSDGRVSPEEDFQADSDGRKPPNFGVPAIEAQAEKWPWLLFITTNFVAGGLLFGIIWKKRRGKQKKST